MKVINIPYDTNVKCDTCGCHFEADLEDMTYYKAYVIRHNENSSYPKSVSVQCPLCKDYITLAKAKPTSDLLNCPFCDSRAEMYETPHLPRGMDYTPRCTNTSCCGRLSKKYVNKETAITMWNRRASDEQR